MTLHLSVVDHQDQTRNLSLHIDQLEHKFFSLNMIIASGDKLISAQLVDGQTIIDLPVDTLYNNSGIDPMINFEEEWQAILKQPHLTAAEFNTTLLDMANKQIVACENQIARYEPFTIRIESFVQHVERMNISSEARQVLINIYERTLDLYWSQLDRCFASHQHLMDLIYRLS